MATQYAFGQIVTSGLVLCLNAGDRNSYPGGGIPWIDLSGNGNNGSLTNGPSFSTANGGSIVLDGIDDWVNLVNFGNYTTSNFTFSYWIYPNSLTTNQPGQGPVVLFKGQFSQVGYYDQIATDGSYYFITNQPGTFQATSTNPGLITAGRWFNISYTRNGTSIRIYLNGIDVTQTAGTHTNPTNSTELFAIGKYANFIWGNFRIASLLNYNRALSPTEILQNYNATKTRFGL